MANIKRANTSGITKSGVAIPDVPDAPTIGAANNVGTSRAYNNGSATVAFTAAATGGTSTSFTATSTPGGYTASGAGSPLTVTGLQSATSYTFAVTGTNASATGAASAASSSITATTVPQAPTIGTVTRTNNTTVSVPFTGATGGSNITSATVTSSPSISLSTSGTSSPLTVTGTFVQGQAYTFTLTTTNANGTSGSSASSNSLTPFAATAPAAPTIGTVSVTNSTTVSVPYTDGAANGSAITSRTITSSPSISLSYSTSSASPVSVTGSFVAGTAYTFSMTATNGAGTSSSSSASNAITPNPIPKAGFFTAGVDSTPTMFSTVSKLQYSNETISNTGNMAHAGQNAHGASNPGVAGYIVGGVGLNAGDITTNVQKVSFITGTVSVPANLPNDGYLYGRSAVSNYGTAAYFSGGVTQNYANVTNVSYLFSYSTESSSTSNALPASMAYQGAWDNSSTAGYIFGGSVAGEKFPSETNTVRKITYSNSTWSTITYTLPTSSIATRSYSDSGTAGYAQNGSSMLKFVYSTETGSYSATGLSVANGNIRNDGMSYQGVAGYSPGSSSTAMYKFLFSNNTQSTLAAAYTTRREAMGSVSNA